ncbi:MAG TPA: hypothetical protein VF121_14530 [Thermoanaerobaculia bacterium]|nr:hypothetical protein [Thermoanaerobaculia bacterium]
MPLIRLGARAALPLVLSLASVLAAAVPAASAPWLSTAVQGLPISFDDCRSRVGEALAAEGYGNLRDFGNGWLGFTASHSVSLGCVHGANETVVVVTVASEGDNTAQRDRLLERVRTPKGAAAKHVTVERGAQGNVVVRWKEMPGNEGDWISIQPVGAPDDSYGATWTYTGGKREGTYEAGQLAPGEYEVRVYYDWPNGGFNVRERVRFRVD